MTTFTPVAATVGGVLIGLGAVALMAANGRIAGISGIAGSLLPPRPANDWGWRLAFVVGLVVGVLAPMLVMGVTPTVTFAGGLPLMVAAGLLVGFGTTIGNGCTSGHGVCGLARFSPRSLAAVLTFMLTAGIVVFVVRHGLGG